ncbi:MAG: hypothetical protein J6K96_02525 [Treponema sp.]|nr:hypothetical protein [Treponema sp.]
MKKALIAAAVAVLGISCFSQGLNPGDIMFQPQMNIVQNSFAEGIPLGYVFYSDGTESISRKKMDDVLQAAPGNARLVRRAKLWSCMEWLSFAGGMIFSDAADSSSGHFLIHYGQLETLVFSCLKFAPQKRHIAAAVPLTTTICMHQVLFAQNKQK